MKLTVLASGSGGNATYVESKGITLLIDCGISRRQILQRLRTIDLTLDTLQGILITHEHGDHIKGLDVLLRQHQVNAYMTQETFNGIHERIRLNLDHDLIQPITPFESFYIEHIKITPISISHDASDAVGYVIEAEEKKIVYVTDIGYLPARDHDAFRNADFYIFESNYDVTMLFTSARPFYLKQRIDSVKGHMSNTDSAYNLAQIVGDKTTNIVLAHRSKECNTDELVLTTYRDVFTDYGLDINRYQLTVAKQDVPTDIFEF